MDTFHLGGKHEDLEHRQRQRHIADLPRVELERQVGDNALPAVAAKKIGAQRRLDQIEKQPQDAILIKARDLLEAGLEGGQLRRRTRLGVLLVRTEAQMKQAVQHPHHLGVAVQHIDAVGLCVGHLDLVHVAAVCTKQ